MAILWVRHRLHVEQVIVLMPSDFASATGLLWTTHHELLHWVLQRASHPQDGLVVNFTSHTTDGRPFKPKKLSV